MLKETSLSLKVVACESFTNGSAPPCKIMVGTACAFAKVMGLLWEYAVEFVVGVAPLNNCEIEDGGANIDAGSLYMAAISVGPKKSTTAFIFTGELYL